jgi:hypothetical protein
MENNSSNQFRIHKNKQEVGQRAISLTKSDFPGTTKEVIKRK